MKAVIAFVCLALLQISQSFPVDDPPCKALFKDEICEGWEAIDEMVSDEMPDREKRTIDKALLEKLLKEKINFLLGFGLLKNIPFVGEFVHNLVERDPEGVSKALSGGIMAVAGLVLGNLNIG